MINKTYEKLLFIDTETGGIDPTKHSLLSVGLVAWDSEKGVVDTKEVFVKSDNYIVVEKARIINKFNKEEHELNAVFSKDALKEILIFVDTNFEDNVLTPLAGHNVQFDVNFLKKFLIDNGRSYNTIFSHRIVDTYSISRYLIYSGYIKRNISSSSDLFKYFNIKVEQRHSALSDVVATVELFEKMIKLIS